MIYGLNWDGVEMKLHGNIKKRLEVRSIEKWKLLRSGKMKESLRISIPIGCCTWHNLCQLQPPCPGLELQLQSMALQLPHFFCTPTYLIHTPKSKFFKKKRKMRWIKIIRNSHFIKMVNFDAGIIRWSKALSQDENNN